MLETLISSKTRVKLLVKFFLNSNTRGYLRNLEAEFGESTNAIRLELNRLEEAGMLSSEMDGNKKMFRANTRHPLFEEVHRILIKYMGLDQVIDHVIKRLGELELVYLSGDLARGMDSQVIDLILVGHPDKKYLVELIEKAEGLISRKIRYLLLSREEFRIMSLQDNSPRLLLWSNTD